MTTADNRLVQAIMNSEAPDFLKRGAVEYVGRSSLNGRFLLMSDLTTELIRQSREKADYIVDCRSLKMELGAGNNPILAFPAKDGSALHFNIKRACHEQIGEKTNIPAKYYQRMQGQRPGLLCENVNAWLPDKETRRIRTLDGFARAMVSDRFKALDNSDLFFAAFQTFKDAGCEILRADLTEDWFRMDAVSPDIRAHIPWTQNDAHAHKFTNDDLLGGVRVSNSETGRGALNVEGFTFRLVCANGLVGENVFARTHLGEKLQAGVYREETITQTTKAIWMQAQDHIKGLLNDVHVKLVADQMAGAATVEIPVGTTELVKGNWGGLDITQTERDAILKHLLEDGEGQTQFGFVQAMTAAARDQSDADRRAEIERMGYGYLTMKGEKFQQEIRVLATPARGRVIA